MVIDSKLTPGPAHDSHDSLLSPCYMQVTGTGSRCVWASLESLCRPAKPAHASTEYVLDVCTGPAEGGDLVGEALLELQGSQGRAELAILHNHDGHMYSRCGCFPACGRVCGGPLGCRTMLPALTASKRHVAHCWLLTPLGRLPGSGQRPELARRACPGSQLQAQAHHLCRRLQQDSILRLGIDTSPCWGTGDLRSGCTSAAGMWGAWRASWCSCRVLWHAGS